MYKHKASDGEYGEYWSIQPSEGEGFLWVEFYKKSGIKILSNSIVKIPEKILESLCAEMTSKLSEFKQSPEEDHGQ